MAAVVCEPESYRFETQSREENALRTKAIARSGYLFSDASPISGLELAAVAVSTAQLQYFFSESNHWDFCG